MHSMKGRERIFRRVFGRPVPQNQDEVGSVTSLKKFIIFIAIIKVLYIVAYILLYPVIHDYSHPRDWIPVLLKFAFVVLIIGLIVLAIVLCMGAIMEFALLLVAAFYISFFVAFYSGALAVGGAFYHFVWIFISERHWLWHIFIMLFYLFILCLVFEALMFDLGTIAALINALAFAPGACDSVHMEDYEYAHHNVKIESNSPHSQSYTEVNNVKNESEDHSL